MQNVVEVPVAQGAPEGGTRRGIPEPGGVVEAPGQDGALTAIPGAVISGGWDGVLRILDSSDGHVLWEYNTIRDFKTVNGLERVHGILRRLDDDFCDPVELRADSALGIPGLVQAWRAGGVLVANALGERNLVAAGDGNPGVGRGST